MGDRGKFDVVESVVDKKQINFDFMKEKACLLDDIEQFVERRLVQVLNAESLLRIIVSVGWMCMQKKHERLSVLEVLEQS